MIKFVTYKIGFNMIRRQFILTLILLLTAGIVYAQDIAGRWAGEIEIMNTKLGIVTEFRKAGDSLTGTIDIPMQGAMGLKLTSIKVKLPDVSFDLVVAPGNIATFRGKLLADSISGDFSQSGYSGLFHLGREAAKKDLPFIEKEVKIRNGSHELAGTLTIPKKAGKYPAMIMVTGSGPQTRDEDIFGFKIFKIIAEHLTNSGIAVLRYDDRGVGYSSGDYTNATTQDFSEDILAAYLFLLNEKDIDVKKIGVLGHSEGSTAALMAASKEKDFKFVVLMAGPGLPGKEIIVSQIQAMMEAEKIDKVKIDKSVALQRKLIDAIVSDNDITPMKDELLQYRLDEFLASNPQDSTIDTAVIRKQLATGLESELAYMQGPWYKFFLKCDPVEFARQVRSPVLMMYGDKDTQVPWEVNSKSLIAAFGLAGNSNVQVKLFNNANHIFQQCESGSPTEYATLSKEFVPGFLKYLEDWIKEKVK
jgi:pimeloyl-ACP methyl ester carboxylesterase